MIRFNLRQLNDLLSYCVGLFIFSMLFGVSIYLFSGEIVWRVDTFLVYLVLCVMSVIAWKEQSTYNTKNWLLQSFFSFICTIASLMIDCAEFSLYPIHLDKCSPNFTGIITIGFAFFSVASLCGAVKTFVQKLGQNEERTWD